MHSSSLTQSSYRSRDSGPSVAPAPASAPPASLSSSSQTKSSIVIEKRDEVVQPNVSSSLNDPAGGLASLKRKDPSAQKAKEAAASKKAKVGHDKAAGAMLFPPLKPSGTLCHQAAHYAVSVTHNKNLSHLQVVLGDSNEPLWDQYLGYTATAIASSPTIIAVSLEDESVHTFYTMKGARATPPLVPPGPIAKIHAAGSSVRI